MNSFLKAFKCLVLGVCLSLFSAQTSQAVLKIPTVDIKNSIAINDVSELLDFTRFNDGWIVSGINDQNQSWVSRINQSGNSIWRVFPVIDGNGGDGFITAIGVDSQGILLAGISQREITVSAQSSPTPSLMPSPTSSPTPTPTPTPPSTKSPDRSIPLVNPDNVTPRTELPLREDLSNLFFVRLDLNGKLSSVINYKNSSLFVPNSIVSINNDNFLSGNEQVSEIGQRGALYKFSNGSFAESYSYGKSRTIFSKAIVNTSKTITIIGSSSETIASRTAVGPSDGIILTISSVTGKVTKIVRSSAPGASRSWTSASGNLLVSGPSQTKSLKESVITSFTAKGNVSWTSKYQKSDAVLANENCVAVSLIGQSAALPFTSKGSEIFLYSVDSKGKILKGVRLPSQALIALTTSPGKANGCALLTYSSAAGARVSFL